MVDAALAAPNSLRQDWLRALVIFLLTLLAYGYATQCGYIWDDDMYVYQNPTLFSLKGLYDIWFTPGATPQYYPLVFTGFWIQHALFGMEPFTYHLVNILLHAANAILIWRLMLRLKVPGAWLIGLIFAVHPVNVESVAWVTERKNVLSMLFYLLSAHALISWSPPDEEAKPLSERPHRFYALAFAAFLAALLSKTTACTLPAAWLLVLWWKRGAITLRDAVYALPLFILGGAFGLWTAHLEKTHVGAEGGEWAFNFLERIQIAGNVTCFYAMKLLLPVNLAFVYPRWEISSARLVMYLGPIVALGLIGLFWLYRHKLGRGPLAAWLFFIGTLFPALGFFNVYPFRYSFVADHFQYLATFGFIALVVAGLTRLFDSMPGDTTRFRQTLAGVFIAVLAVCTFFQTLAYTSAKTLWQDTLAKNPTAWLASNNLGMILRDERNYEEAQKNFELTVALNPRMLEGRMNLAEVLIEQGKFADALPHIKEAQAIEPRHPEPVMAEGRVLKLLGRQEEAQERLLAAAAIYENVVAARPESTLGLFGLGRAYNATEQPQRAVEVLSVLVKLTPGDALAWSELGMAYLKAGDVPRAVANYLNALQLMPENGEVINRLGRILATTDDDKLRDPERAQMLADECVRLTNAKAPAYLDTQALAYGARGDFKKAIESIRSARALAEHAGFVSLLGALDKHEAAFREEKPVRMTPKELAE